MSETEQTGTPGVGILVAAFPTETAGEEALKALKEAKKQRQVYYEEAAVIRQSAEGEVHYHETGDMSTGKGAGIGALVGGVIGILGGPAGIVVGAGAGAIIGGAAAHGDAGFRDASLEQLGVALKPDTSAVALISSSQFLHAVRKEVSDDEMRTAVGNLSQEISARLEEGKSVAIGLVLTEEGLAVTEVAADDKTTEIIRVVANEDGVIGGAAVATEEGVAYAVEAVTADATEYEVGVATDDAAAVEHGVITDEGGVITRADVTEDEAVSGTALITPVDTPEEEKKEE